MKGPKGSSDLLASYEAQLKEAIALSANTFNGGDIPIREFAKQYPEGSKIHTEILRELAPRFKGVTKERGDGNCFYRCMIRRLVERCRVNEGLREEMVKQCCEVSTHCPEFMTFLIDPHQELTEKVTLSGVRGLRELGAYKFGSTHFKDTFQPLGTTVEARSALMRTMGEEAEEPEIVAVLMALQGYFSLNVVKLDKNGVKCVSLEAPGGSQKDVFRISMLFRPGHYDLLY